VKELYAHSANSQGQRHRLDDHLKGTAERAANMAKEFGCSRWGWLAGLWHDLGEVFKRLSGNNEAKANCINKKR